MILISTVTLGKTGITVQKNGFGALPVQRANMENSIKILRLAYESGINFFDTARFYTDSEEKIGAALSDVRDKIIIATKTKALNADEFWKDLETSLTNMKTDYVDIYQFHNPPFVPRPGDGTGLFEAMEQAKAEGKVLHIGFTNHQPHLAREAVESGLYETLQFPFCYLATDIDTSLVALCREKNVGFIAMKGLSGGLITNSAAAYAYIAQFDNVVPIWGIQRESELREFISYIDNPPRMTEEIKAEIERDRRELIGNFCRSCGYCMPCPQGIIIRECARMSQLIRRSPSAPHLTEESKKMMFKIEDCINCGHCKSMCPYGLDTPNLLRQNLEDYKNIISGKTKI